MDGKKKKNLRMREKISILDELERGLSAREIAIQHGVSRNAIYNIKRRRHDFEAAAASCGDISLDKKSLKTTKHRNLEEALLIWLRQKRNLGEPVSGPLVSKKAMVFNEKLGENPDFKAGHGWLCKFKNRHGIKINPVIKDYTLSADTQNSENFTNTFRAYIEACNYDVNNIYNADESGLHWRSLPRRVLAMCEEHSPSGRRDEDRVTVTFCANASGTHRLPVLVIGKHKQPTCFQNVTDLSVTYKAQTSVWMDPFVFLDWYKNNFIPLVKKQQAMEGRQGKVLLLLDNVPSHPPENVLNAIDANFEVKYLPPNVSDLIQPMDQGPIETAKSLYRKNLMRNLVNNESGIKECMKNFNLKDCCDLIAEAWSNVASSTLVRAWKAFIPLDESGIKDLTGNCGENVNASDLTDTLNLALGSNLHERELENWFTVDMNDNGWEIMNDDEILASVTNRGQILTENKNSSYTVTVKLESATASVTTTKEVPPENENFNHTVLVKLESDSATVTTEEQMLPEEDNYDNTVFVKLENGVENSYEMLDTKDIPNSSYSAEEAVQALDIVFSWLDQQPECFTHDLAALNRIRDLAISKSVLE